MTDKGDDNNNDGVINAEDEEEVKWQNGIRCLVAKQLRIYYQMILWHHANFSAVKHRACFIELQPLGIKINHIISLLTLL